MKIFHNIVHEQLSITLSNFMYMPTLVDVMMQLIELDTIVPLPLLCIWIWKISSFKED